MRFVYIGSVSNPHAATSHDLTVGDQFMLFPGHSESSTSESGADFTDYPLSEERGFWMERWWRQKRMQCEFQAILAGSSFEGTEPMDLTNSVQGEASRRKVTNDTWAGEFDETVDISDPRRVTFSVQMFGGNQPDYYWRGDLTPPRMVPFLSISGDVEAGDSSAHYSSGERPPPGERTPDYFEKAISFFGRSIQVWVNPNTVMNPSDFNLTFTGLEWFEWRGGQFNLPKWDKDTGAKLGSSWPPYA